jgi:hypothetical protein
MSASHSEKSLHWVGSAKIDLLALPDEVINDFGYALGAVQLGATPAQIEAARPDALLWALERGSRSGRVAYQFARDMMGRQPGQV